MLTVCASYDGHPVSVLLDPATPQSLVSSQFALKTNIPRKVHFAGVVVELWANGPIRVSTSSGWYESRMPFLVTYVPNHDVVLGGDWFGATRATKGGCFVCDPPDTVTPLPEGHRWVASPFLSYDPYVCVANTGGAAVDSAPSLDDGCEASSSRGPGSMHEVARAEMPYNIAYAVSVVVPQAESQSVFRADASVEFVQSMCASHGIHSEHGINSDDISLLQRSLLEHILSGACVSHSGHQTNGGCLQIAGVFVDRDLLRSTIERSIEDRIHASPTSVVLRLCTLLGSNLSDADDRLIMIADIRLLMSRRGVVPDTVSACEVCRLLDGIHDCSLEQLRPIADGHGLNYSGETAMELVSVVFCHISTGGCERRSGTACELYEAAIVAVDDDSRFTMDEYQMRVLNVLARKLSGPALRRLAEGHGVPHNPDASISHLRRTLKRYVTAQGKGKGRPSTVKHSLSKERRRWHHRKRNTAVRLATEMEQARDFIRIPTNICMWVLWDQCSASKQENNLVPSYPAGASAMSQ